MSTADTPAGCVATGGGLAKSLLGNRFVGQPPSVHAAASDVVALDPTAMHDRGDGSEGVPANKAIPEERLGRYPLDAGAAAHQECLGRHAAERNVTDSRLQQ